VGGRLSNAPGIHFLQRRRCLEWNSTYKVGKKHHYFLKFGGDLIHAQPFKQYLEEPFLTKPKHSVRGASCDFLMYVAESIDKHGTSSDEGMLVRAANFLQDFEIKKEQSEENTPILNEHQKHAITMHINSKYAKLDANKFPVLARLNISNSDGFVTQHYCDVILTELLYLLGKENRCIDYKNYKNGQVNG
jgi:hypothetical protein